MRLRLLALLASLALALSACGGDDDNGGSGDEDQIRDLVEVFYSNEEGVCDSVTDELIKSQFQSQDACEKAAEDAEPEEGYEVGEITVDGDTGTVEIDVDGETGTLTLKKEDGEWKVHGIEQ